MLWDWTVARLHHTLYVAAREACRRYGLRAVSGTTNLANIAPFRNGTSATSMSLREMQATIRCSDTDQQCVIDLPMGSTDVARNCRMTIASRCPHCGRERASRRLKRFTRDSAAKDAVALAYPEPN